MPFICFTRSRSFKLTAAERQIVNKYRIKVSNFRSYHLSASAIRAGKQLNRQIPVVNEYINKHYLYAHSRLLAAHPQNIRRFQHSQAVAQKAQDLAKLYGFQDLKKAYYTGLLHDITKY